MSNKEILTRVYKKHAIWGGVYSVFAGYDAYILTRDDCVLPLAVAGVTLLCAGAAICQFKKAYRIKNQIRDMQK